MKLLTITMLLLAAVLVLAGCEAEDAGTARAQSAAMQNQMNEMSGLVSKLISQNEQLQNEVAAASSGTNTLLWVLGTLLVAGVLVGGGMFAVWYVKYTNPPPMQQPDGGWQPQYIALPQPQDAAALLPDNMQAALDAHASQNGWAWVVRNGRVMFIDARTGSVEEVSKPVALLEDS